MYEKILADIKKQSISLALVSEAEKNKILIGISKSILGSKEEIIRANRKDLVSARKSKKSSSFIDRLILNGKRIDEMAAQVRDVAGLKLRIGELIEERKRPNGLLIRKVRVPLGVIFVIYESRPNVTSDCAALCFKSGNAVVLRGGSDALNSNRAIYSAIKSALPADLKDAVYFVDGAGYEAVKKLLKMNKFIDAVIPRGGEKLIQTVVSNSTIPVIYHGKGICHLYVHEDADIKMALKIALNAKVQRPGVCNAIETLLVDRRIAGRFLPVLYGAYKKENVEMRGDRETLKILKNIKPAKKADWDTEYLDRIISIKIVKNLVEAAGFINEHGSRHSEAIVTGNKAAAGNFFRTVDAACVYHNASTRFTDGGQFGMGAEIGISNQKLHARGPVGLKELTTYKYVVSGAGQIRK
ncbi:MAG: glutamate-5-semialdehyde dehydrogenase [bacterium]